MGAFREPVTSMPPHSDLTPDHWSPADLDGVISALATEPRLTTALRLAERLRMAAALAPDAPVAAARLAQVVHDGDDVSALAAIHALGSVPHASVDDVLLGLVLDGDEPFAGHAAWALAGRASTPAAVEALERLAGTDGFSAMLAERTLVEWSRLDRGVAPPVPPPIADWWAEPGNDSNDDSDSDGIVVIQPFLHARLDRDGSSLGSGDAGGIASLLRSLGSSLAGVDGIAEVVTVTRRHRGEAASEQIAPGHRVVRLPVGGDGPLPWRQAWVHRIEIERRFVELGRSFVGRRVVWHLRMADVGTLAAAAAARSLGQPVVFTAAPDPHIVIGAAGARAPPTPSSSR